MSKKNQRKVTIDNATIEILSQALNKVGNPDTPISKLLNSDELSGRIKVELLEPIFKITGSSTAQAYFKMKGEIAATFPRDQQNAIPLNHEKFRELLSMTHEFSIDKVTIKADDIPKKISVSEMSHLSWLVNWSK